MKPELPELPRLLFAARETVHDATQPADAPNRSRDIVECAPRVQDQRQVEFSCELELAIEIDVLRIAIQCLDVEIEAAFAHRDGPLACNPVGEFGEMPGLVFCEIHRMQAIGRI